MKMNKKVSIIFSIFFIAFLFMPSLALAGTCIDSNGFVVPLTGTQEEQKEDCERLSGTEWKTTEAGGGSEEEVCPTCPAGTICFQNPIGACSVKKFVSNLLGRLQGIIALIAIVVIVIGGIMYMASFGNEEAMKKAKSVIGAALIGLALTLAAPSFIKEILLILEGSNVNPGDIDSALTVQEILLNILNFLLSIVGIIAIIAMILGGRMYLTSSGDEEEAKKGKQIITYAVIGIVIALGSLIVVKQIAVIFGLGPRI